MNPTKLLAYNSINNHNKNFDYAKDHDLLIILNFRWWDQLTDAKLSLQGNSWVREDFGGQYEESALFWVNCADPTGTK